MKAREYFEKEYENGHIEFVSKNEDYGSLYDLIDEYGEYIKRQVNVLPGSWELSEFIRDAYEDISILESGVMEDEDYEVDSLCFKWAEKLKVIITKTQTKT